MCYGLAPLPTAKKICVFFVIFFAVRKNTLIALKRILIFSRLFQTPIGPANFRSSTTFPSIKCCVTILSIFSGVQFWYQTPSG
jgi:hypothetical protein